MVALSSTPCYRRAELHYYAFDCLWLDGEDLRGAPLLERKRILRDLIPPQPSRLLDVNHIAECGTDLYRAASETDLEGVIAKWASAPYGTEPPSWIKIKNPAYSQAMGRRERFEKMNARRARAAGLTA